MGMLSSWAMFSSTHHLLIRWLAKTLGKPKGLYAVLGDDVLIFDTQLAELYRVTMERLGVTINLLKSTI